ncbi:hypothetical protein DSO57_1010899 [Entomophthora muscae]|uniref:Uncharacterized protein n=1 Tax=Entomophthora muscae TaxID=34485 RepID=A0ACC2T6J7_9FUNG|nr:hypothetical protein DSO57_1010899 [Entomophthora muscae]
MTFAMNIWKSSTRQEASCKSMQESPRMFPQKPGTLKGIAYLNHVQHVALLLMKSPFLKPKILTLLPKGPRGSPAADIEDPNRETPQPDRDTPPRESPVPNVDAPSGETLKPLTEASRKNPNPDAKMSSLEGSDVDIEIMSDDLSYLSDLTSLPSSEDEQAPSPKDLPISSEAQLNNDSSAIPGPPRKYKKARRPPKLANKLKLSQGNSAKRPQNLKRRGKSPKAKEKATKKSKLAPSLPCTKEPNKSCLKPNPCTAELEVEMVLARKQVKRSIFYLIKWKGFPDSYNTWEPSEMLSCDEFIQAFEAAIEDNALVDEWTSIDVDGYQIITLPPNIRSFIELFSQDDGPVVSVYNDIDKSGPPENFTAINQNVFREGVIQPAGQAVGCTCNRDCRLKPESTSCSCNHLQQTKSLYPTYSGKGLLKFKTNNVIYECNSKCACPPSCTNRTVQNGRQVKIQIFKTEDKGWGVRALQKIKKGSFIMEYVGEVITSDEAERRGVLYDARQSTYLFDMDYEHGHAEDCSYTIDACFFGNSSHFFNHSCDPNLAVFPVFIESYSFQLYRLGFFATRDIDYFDELTFDYLPQAQANDSGSSDMPITKYKCFCHTDKCRGFFHI